MSKNSSAIQEKTKHSRSLILKIDLMSEDKDEVLIEAEAEGEAFISTTKQ